MHWTRASKMDSKVTLQVFPYKSQSLILYCRNTNLERLWGENEWTCILYSAPLNYVISTFSKPLKFWQNKNQIIQCCPCKPILKCIHNFVCKGSRASKVKNPKIASLLFMFFVLNTYDQVKESFQNGKCKVFKTKIM